MTSPLPHPALLFIRNFSLFLILVTCDLILHQISKTGLPCPGTVSAEDVQGAPGCCCLWAYPQAGPPPPLSLSFLICKWGRSADCLGQHGTSEETREEDLHKQRPSSLRSAGWCCAVTTQCCVSSSRKAAVDCLCPQRAYVKSRLPG